VDVVPHGADEVVVCPTPGCGKAFQVHVPTAAPAAKLVAPENQEKPGGAGETEAQVNPPIAENLADKEEELQIIRLHMFRRYPFRFAGYIGLIVGGLILGLATLANGWWLAAVLCVAIMGFAALRLTKWWLRMRHRQRNHRNPFERSGWNSG
jgi:hypothetical protein